ncbi:MAG: hypothetical protein O2809_00670 [Proteobacteria bacterium]|nr:hypothetical protein [Pseudomonadota bacterium]
MLNNKTMIKQLSLIALLTLSGCASTHIVKDKDAPINYSYAVYDIHSKPLSLNEAFNDIKVYLNQYGSKVEISTASANYPLATKPSQFKKVSAGFLGGGFKLDSQGDTIATCDDAILKANYIVQDISTLMCVFAYQKGYSVNFIAQTHTIDWSFMNSPLVYGEQLLSRHLTTKSVSQHILGMLTTSLNQPATLTSYYPVIKQPVNLIQAG